MKISLVSRPIEVIAPEAARECYKRSPVDIRCTMVNGIAVPLFMLPAGIPLDWRVEAEARARGEWIR